MPLRKRVGFRELLQGWPWPSSSHQGSKLDTAGRDDQPLAPKMLHGIEQELLVADKQGALYLGSDLGEIRKTECFGDAVAGPG